MLDILMVYKMDSSMKQEVFVQLMPKYLLIMINSPQKKSHLCFLSLSAASEKTLCKVLGVGTERK